MTNEQLAALIQQGDAEELKPILWERVHRLLYSKADRLYTAWHGQFDSAGVEAWDIKQACYDAFLAAIAAYKPDSGYQFTTFLSYPFRKEVYALLGIQSTRREPLNDCTSLDKPIENGEGDTTTMLELLPDTSSADTFLAIEEQGEADADHAAVERLSDPRQREVIRQYYFDGKPMHAIGRALGVGAERVRQIRAKALLKLSKDSELLQVYELHQWK